MRTCLGPQLSSLENLPSRTGIDVYLWQCNRVPSGGLFVPDFTNPPRGSGCHPPRRGPALAARAIEPFWGLPGSREGDREALQKCSGGHHFWPRDTLPAPRKVSQVARDAGGGLEGLYGPRRNLWLARDLRDHAFRRLVKCFTNSPPRHKRLPPLGGLAPKPRGSVTSWPPAPPCCTDG